MAINYGQLETIHYLLKKRADLSEQLARCPRVIKVAENAVNSYSATVEQLKSDWQKCKKDADAKQLTMNQREARIEDLKTRRNSSASNKEYQLLTEQIAADEQANSVLADEILEMLERGDRIHQQVETAKGHLAAAEKELARVRAETNQKQHDLEKQIAGVNVQIQDQERSLSGDFLLEYRRRVEASNEMALAALVGETCGNCHQVINTQTLSELYQRLPVFCKGCGCILYISPEELALRRS